MINEIGTLVSGENGIRALFLVKKRPIFVPDTEALPEKTGFRAKYLSYPSFWLFERLSHIFGTSFLEDSVLADRNFADIAIPSAGPFLRRRQEYPHVEVTASPDDTARSELTATWLSFFGVPISKWEEVPGATFRILVGDVSHTEFVPAYRHYLNLLMSSAPSVASISRIFAEDLLKVELNAAPGPQCDSVTHELLVNRLEDGERSIVWRAQPTVEVEMACLGHDGIFEAWKSVGNARGASEDNMPDRPIVALQVGENPLFDVSNVSDVFGASVLDRFQRVHNMAAQLIDSERDRRRLERTEQYMNLQADALGGLGHDMKNPLHELIQFAEGFQEGVTSGKRLSEVVLEQAGYVHGNMDLILQAHRVHAGKIVPKPKSIILADVVNTILGWKEIATGVKQIVVEHRRRGDTSIRVFADPHLLMRAVFNLIDNAVKYTEKGGTIVVDAVDTEPSEERGPMVDLTVFNTGNEPIDFDGLFTPFNRGDNDNIPGIGLGLPGARHIAALLGGTLEGASAEGGHIFHLCLKKPDAA
jgi:signal transduction histidine kinase